MIEIRLAGDKLGQVIDSQGSNQYLFAIANSDTVIPIKNQGFDCSPLLKKLMKLKVNESFSISEKLESLSQYTLPQYFELICSTEHIEIKSVGNQQTITGRNIGVAEVLIIVHDEIVDRVKCNVKYPKLPGVPQQWIYEQSVSIPNQLNFKNPSHFEEEYSLSVRDKKYWNMKEFTPFVDFIEDDAIICKLEVVFLEYDSISHEEFSKNLVYFSENRTQRLPALKFPNMFWRDSEGLEIDEISLNLPGQMDFSLMFRAEDDELHCVNVQESVADESERIKLFVEVKQWEFENIIHDNIASAEINLDSFYVQRCIIGAEVLNLIPSQHSFSDFKITVERDDGFPLKRYVCGDDLYIDVACNGKKGYITQIEISVPSSDDVCKIPIYFEQEYDFDKSLFDELEIKIFTEADNIIAVATAKPPFDHPLAKYLQIILCNGGEEICNLNLLESDLKAINPPAPLSSSKFQIVTLWHPYDNNFRFEKALTFEKVERGWLEKFIGHEDLNFHPILQGRMSERFNSKALSNCDSIKHHICNVGSTLQIEDLDTKKFKPVVLYFTKDRHGLGYFHDLDDNDEWSNGARIGYDDEIIPLIKTVEEMTNMKKHANGEFKFLEPGIYIFAYCYSGENTWLGPEGDEWAYEYDHFFEVEVL